MIINLWFVIMALMKYGVSQGYIRSPDQSLQVSRVNDGLICWYKSGIRNIKRLSGRGTMIIGLLNAGLVFRHSSKRNNVNFIRTVDFSVQIESENVLPPFWSNAVSMSRNSNAKLNVNHQKYKNSCHAQIHEFVSDHRYIGGSVQYCNISIANALEILQSCTEPSICN